MDSRSRSDKTQHKYDLPEPLESQPMKLCPTCRPRYECSHLGHEETPRWKRAVFWMTARARLIYWRVWEPESARVASQELFIRTLAFCTRIYLPACPRHIPICDVSSSNSREWYVLVKRNPFSKVEHVPGALFLCRLGWKSVLWCPQFFLHMFPRPTSHGKNCEGVKFSVTVPVSLHTPMSNEVCGYVLEKSIAPKWQLRWTKTTQISRMMSNDVEWCRMVKV